MKIKLIDENNIIVFLNYLITNSKTELKDNLNSLFNKIKDKYNIEIYGYYNINIFIDNNYGSIIEIQKEDIDYIEYDNNQIDMNIRIINNNFLYKINNYFNLKIDSIIYKYNNNYYLKLNKKIDNNKMSLLLELSEIIYKDIDKIIKHGIVLQNSSYVI